jgi:uncharacterized membrane protein
MPTQSQRRALQKAQRLQLQAQMSPKEKFYSQYRHFTKVTLKVGLAVLLFAGISTIGHQPSQNGLSPFEVVLVIYCVLLFVLVMPIVQVVLWRTISAGFDEMRVASTSIPTPSEISWQLGQEWGRPATLEEVAAVYQMLTARKNQALINSGITLGAIYLMGRNL